MTNGKVKECENINFNILTVVIKKTPPHKILKDV